MINSIKLTAFVICFSTFTIMANAAKQNTCPHLLTNSSMVVNIEGKFINEERNRTNMSIEWRHHNNALDTFFVNLYDSPSFKFITSGSYRYMEIGENKIKRQLGLHHLKENIGKTPLKLDDLELLANGYFKCPDSTKQKTSNNVLATANSMMWWSLVIDSLPHPDKAVMHGAQKTSRYFAISNWKSYAGEQLPTLVNIASNDYSGNIWIRSAYPAHALESDPLRTPSVKPKILLPVPKLFGRIAMEGERKIPLILKLNKQLLGE